MSDLWSCRRRGDPQKAAVGCLGWHTYSDRVICVSVAGWRGKAPPTYRGISCGGYFTVEVRSLLANFYDLTCRIGMFGQLLEAANPDSN